MTGMRSRWLMMWAPLGALALLSLACNAARVVATPVIHKPTPTGGPATDTPTTSPTAPATPGPTATPAPELIITPMAPLANPARPLTPEGPWWVFLSGQDAPSGSQALSYVLVNADGSGRRVLAAEQPKPQLWRPSPRGDRFAMVTRPEEGAQGSPRLRIWKLPDGALETEIELLPADFRQRNPELGDLDYLQVLAAVGQAAWSPHGRYLAFTAALDGPSADIYRFDTWTDVVRRLTDEPEQAYLPTWTPDGKWIVYLAAEFLSSGMALEAQAVRAVSADGGEQRQLYAISSGFHRLLFWQDAARLWLVEEGPDGWRNLLRLNVESGELRPLYVGPLAGGQRLAVDDLQQRALFLLSGDRQRGLHVVDLASGDERWLLEGDWQQVVWWPGKGVFLVAGPDGALMVNRAGEVVKTMEEITDPLAPSPDGAWMVAYGPQGAVLYTHIANRVRRITEAPVTAVTWRPDSQGFLLLVPAYSGLANRGHLYHWDMEREELLLVDLDARRGGFWAGPALAVKE